MNWIIYTLKNPRVLDQVRYVGFTSHSPARRLREHIRSALRGKRRTYKRNWILSLLSIGLVPVIEIIESGAGPGWQDAERRWIAHYRSGGARLVNGTDGGEGTFGWGTPEQRSALARQREAAMTREQRCARTRVARAAKTCDSFEIFRASMTPERWSAMARSREAKKTPEDRHAVALARGASKTAEEWSAVARLRDANMTPEQRSARARKGQAAMTPEQRSAAARKREAGKRVRRQVVGTGGVAAAGAAGCCAP
jgi:hypothetical protein